MILHYAISCLKCTKEQVMDSFFSKLQNFKYIELTENDKYVGYNQNEHHWTTEYVWNNFIPLLNNDLQFGFNPDDFNLIENYSKDQERF